LKGSLNSNLYTFNEDIDGKFEQSNAGFGERAFSLMGGINYNITDYFSVFTEIGYGPVLCKFGARISWLPN
jgi:opacity protein-like surface antigen